ncbi:MAG: biotin--[acetyl-CoA-carboxylase] ligase [Pyrinomonadaceae bacterium]|nr:biotin--[acetyl-CoA-carboxylase] ligase [Pyrinomonadaceae bacterium]
MSLQAIILRFDSLPSTNTEAAGQAMRGASEGLCIVAREQTAGRGRHERRWVSPADAGLYFSIVLRPRFELRQWPLITLMAALAVHDALVEACDLHTDIKWPNDIYAEDRKLGGILAETLETETGRAVILGIGLNLSDRVLPHELQASAASVEAVTGNRPDTEALLRALVRAVALRYSNLHSPNGAEQTLEEWTKRSSYAEGKRVRVSVGAEVFEGTTRGLAIDGALRVETDAEEIRTVRAGDVTALRRASTKKGMSDE